MSTFKDFKDLYKDQDIYVVGSGPSLDFISPDFFDNKIVIGLNQIYKKIRVNYLVRKEAKLLETVLKETDKNIIHFISEYTDGVYSHGSNLEILVKNNYYDLRNNIIIYKHNNNNHKVPDNLPQDGLVASYSTITTGIHLAAFMGAKNIILVGHDCGSLDKKCNTKDYHTNATYKIAWKNGREDYIKWLPKIERHTIKLKSMLKKDFGCNIYSLNPFINFGLEGHIYSK